MRFEGVDRILLETLQREGRISNADLAERAGLSASACHRRVKALETAGVVEGYVAILNAEAVGRGLTVSVLVTLENQKRETLERFERAVAEVDEVMECYLTTGADDYLLRLMVRDARDYERVHRERLSGLPGVARLISNIAMRKVFVRTAVKLG